jgi:RNA polymerase sigma-70 factor (ECF subfamily)
MPSTTSGLISVKNTTRQRFVTMETSCHKTSPAGVLTGVARDLAVGMTANDAIPETAVDLDALFRAQFARIARVIARVTRDPSRAEELAVDVFLKWFQTPSAHGSHAIGWLYRTAMRVGLNELRSETRRRWYERLYTVMPGRRSAIVTPEDERQANESREHVRTVLGRLRRRQAALLVLRSDGLSYAEIAAALNVNPTSVGTLLARAEVTFQKEYIKRYGTD